MTCPTRAIARERPLVVSYRCVKCGWEFTELDQAPSTVAEVLEFWRCIDMRCNGRIETVKPVTPPDKAGE